MIYLLDENFSALTGEVMTLLGREHGDIFLHIVEDLGAASTEDEDIPALCRSANCTALITINHRDFGAKKLLYQSLVANGLSVVVVRPGKLRMNPTNQVSLLSGKYPAIRSAIEEAPNLLVRVSPTDVVSRTLDDLIEESRVPAHKRRSA